MPIKDFRNDEDVRESQEMSKQDTGKYVRFDAGKTPFYILKTAYADGFIHWVRLPNGDNKKIVCLAPLKDDGYNPDVCPICKIVGEQGQEWRALEKSGRLKNSKILREKNRQMTGKYEMVLLVAVGEMRYVGGTGKDRKLKPDMSDPKVGILTLTKSTKEALLGLEGNPQYPYIESRADLFNRILLANKKKTPVTWSEEEVLMTTFIPAKRPSAKPEVEYDEEEMDLNEFEPNEEDALHVSQLYTGELVEDDEVEYEGEDEDLSEDDFEDAEEDGIDAEEEDDFGEADFDPEPEADDDADGFEFDDSEEEDDVEVEVADDDFDSAFLDDISDDEFEDDIPWGAEEEKPAIPEEAKPRRKADTTKKSSPSKSKATSSTSKSQSKPSGTAQRPASKSTGTSPQRKSSAGTTPKSGTKSSSSAKARPTTSKSSGNGTRKAQAGTGGASKSRKGTPKKSDF